ncbi:MAG: DUF4214 domain-containing protein [Pseudomonadota bacterium]
MLATTYDLSRFDGPIRDQQSLGACMSFAICDTIDTIMRQAGHAVAPLSTLGLYQQTLIAQGTPNIDYGSIPIVAMQVARDVGIGLESEWPYDVTKLTEPAPPGAVLHVEAYSEGNIYQNGNAVQSDLRTMLSQGKPVIMVFKVHPFFFYETGPLGEQVNQGDGEIAGLHAVELTGVNALARYDVVRNQWTQFWGDNGYGTLSFDQLSPLNPSHDLVSFYTIDKVGGMDFTWSAERQLVATEYATVLGRAPDVAGMDWWASLIKAGAMTRAGLADVLLASAEGAALHAAEGNVAFVADVYHTVLGRAADSGGQAFWAGVLDTGLITRGDLFAAFFDAVAGEAYASDLLANKTNLAAYVAIANQYDGLHNDIVREAMAHVTNDANLVELIKIGLSHDLGLIT